MLYRPDNMTNEDRKRFVEVCGKTSLYLAEGKPLTYIARELNLNPDQISHNIFEELFVIRKSMGKKLFAKAMIFTLFRK